MSDPNPNSAKWREKVLREAVARERDREGSHLFRVEQAHACLHAATQEQQEARQTLREAVLEARKDHTLAEIGKVLGTSRQGVYDLLNR